MTKNQIYRRLLSLFGSFMQLYSEGVGYEEANLPPLIRITPEAEAMLYQVPYLFRHCKELMRIYKKACNPFLCHQGKGVVLDDTSLVTVTSNGLFLTFSSFCAEKLNCN